MKRLARKAVLATAITCYVAMVTGTTLHLHLLSRQHPEEHDAAHCSICQQSLIAPGKFITEPELIILDHSPRTDTVEFQSESYFIPCHFGPSSPRAPPNPSAAKPCKFLDDGLFATGMRAGIVNDSQSCLNE